ncbi:MAG: histidine kinase [Spirosomaceae bacterium]|nr:histidine kinase [Spirosomataceae bacterium]
MTISSGQMVKGYFPYYRSAADVSNVQYDKITDLIYAFAALDANGNLQIMGPGGTPDLSLFNPLTSTNVSFWRYAYWIGMVLVGGMLTLYGYYYWLGRFDWRKKYPLLIGGTLIWLLLYPVFVAFARSYLDTYLFNFIGFEGLPVNVHQVFWRFFYSSFTRSITFVGAGFVLRFFTDYIAALKRETALKQAATAAELASLKNQINPHLLYNTLSFLYAQARPVSEKLAESVLTLSDMMRYSLHEEDSQGLVSLDKEVQHIQNFIKIHQLRFDNRLAVEFQVEGELIYHKILPLSLISFVENAFKHGKTNDSQHPIYIQLSVSNSPQKQIHFYIRNHKSDGPKEMSSGIGMANVQRRLELVYGKNHTLKVENTNEVFEIHLHITE